MTRRSSTRPAPPRPPTRRPVSTSSSSTPARPARPAPPAYSQRRPVATSAAPAPAPAPAQSHPVAPPQAMQVQSGGGGGGGMLSGLASTMAQGFALGTGSAVAHRVVDGVMGPRGGSGEVAPAPQQEAVQAMPAHSAPMQQSQVCQDDMDSLRDCLDKSNGSASQCRFYMDMLERCQEQQRMFS